MLLKEPRVPRGGTAPLEEWSLLETAVLAEERPLLEAPVLVEERPLLEAPVLVEERPFRAA